MLYINLPFQLFSYSSSNKTHFWKFNINRVLMRAHSQSLTKVREFLTWLKNLDNAWIDYLIDKCLLLDGR